VTRVAIVVLALLLGAAAPARAWCEATCLAPVEASSKAHCPSHDSASTGVAMSATTIDDCPAVDAARPTTIARPELKASLATIESPHPTASFIPISIVTIAPRETTVFERHIPLRI
jgi:hypothetical protein